MWRETVAPAILAAQATRRVTVHRRIKCFGVGESKLEAMLPDMIRRGREPRVGITVSDATITLRITASGPDEAACRRLIAPTEAQIRELLGVLVFGEEEDELQHAVVRLLKERRKTVAVAESATDGLLDHWLADADAESSTLLGGVVLHEPASLPARWKSMASMHAAPRRPSRWHKKCASEPMPTLAWRWPRFRPRPARRPVVKCTVHCRSPWPPARMCE